MEVRHAIAAVHAEGAELLEAVLALHAPAHGRVQALEHLRHDDAVAAVLAEQREEVLRAGIERLARFHVELMDFINDDQRVLEVIFDHPALCLGVLSRLEHLDHVLRLPAPVRHFPQRARALHLQ